MLSFDEFNDRYRADLEPIDAILAEAHDLVDSKGGLMANLPRIRALYASFATLVNKIAAWLPQEVPLEDQLGGEEGLSQRVGDFADLLRQGATA